MSDILKSIVERAKSLNKNIVLTEGEDARVVKAAAEAAAEKIARITLLGNAEAIKKNNPDADLSGVTIVDPVTDERTAKYAEMLFELRKGKINKKTGLPEYADAEAAKKEAADVKNSWLRTAADFENYKKRNADRYKYSYFSFLFSLLLLFFFCKLLF